MRPDPIARLTPIALVVLGVATSLAVAAPACAQGRGRGGGMGGFAGARFAPRPTPRGPCSDEKCSAEQRLAARHERREAQGGFYDIHGRYQH